MMVNKKSQRVVSAEVTAHVDPSIPLTPSITQISSVDALYPRCTQTTVYRVISTPGSSISVSNAEFKTELQDKERPNPKTDSHPNIHSESKAKDRNQNGKLNKSQKANTTSHSVKLSELGRCFVGLERRSVGLETSHRLSDLFHSGLARRCRSQIRTREWGLWFAYLEPRLLTRSFRRPPITGVCRLRFPVRCGSDAGPETGPSWRSSRTGSVA
jgi:hypothetical protein